MFRRNAIGGGGRDFIPMVQDSRLGGSGGFTEFLLIVT
jgi:hypothetical protein